MKRFEIPGRLTVLEGNGDLLKLEATTEWSRAEIYFHGAHVTDFRKHGEPPLLFTSQCSRFTSDHPIRGGIPVIFPWFGPREGLPTHGFARIARWELHEATAVPEGGVSLRFGFPETALSTTWPPFSASYVVTITDRLVLALILTNLAPEQPLVFENCLHSYFHLGALDAASVHGLQGATYLDKTDNFNAKTETADAIRIASETDRIYLDSPGTVELLDPTLHRRIRIEKSGSASTVVWNPWIARAQQIPDLGNDDYLRMICIESGNVDRNRITLPPGHSNTLQVALSSAPL
ncbi:MAG: D-hexose-6-phosphate mutarotase [Verrucomicrobia bacterium]|nr:D-hexose-6-phosphate mutarotase [Verrucomicrobiota bacterium]